MPSLLSRFLGKKKNANLTPLLDGEKYEVVVPKTPSPSVATFPESAQRSMSPSKSKTKEQHGKSFGIPIRRKQVPSSVPTDSKVNELPILSLNLPDPKLEEKRLQGLGVVFEGITDGPPRLDDDVLGAKRLTAAETLILVQKTSEVICERALETLGVMRPHWFASPRQQDVQLQLINRFLQTLSGSRTNGIATCSNPSPATFESELRYTRDPHDVAAVFRWGLRHLQLDGNSFSSPSSVNWYRSFVDSERSGSYPSKAFDNFLLPLLPVSHAQVLCATLELISSLAAHSEENGISGNKLSKVMGWWIVGSRNVQALGWREFYAQWETAARQFEHIFLAYIRAQQAQARMPKRLTELVKNYPYSKNRREDDGIFLPRSRFSTRSATALFVRVTADKSYASSRPHPLRIVEDAFKADAQCDSKGEYAALWQNIRTIASKPASSGDESQVKSETAEAEASLNLSNILADETIRLLSLVPASDGPSDPTLSLFTPLPRRSYTAGDRSTAISVPNGSTHPKDVPSNDKATGSPSVSNRELDVATDWQAFSSAGFNSPSGLSLAASLWDTDTEISHPAPKKAAGAGKRNLSVKSGPPRHVSADSPLVPSAPSNQHGRLTYEVPQTVKLDEAFIDFWADTLLDSITRSWPTFVVCQLKAIPTLRLTESDKPIEWLVIERVRVEPTRSLPPPVKTSTGRAVSPAPASPTRSEGSKTRWAATTLAATRKRWSMFSPKHESAPVVQRGRDVAVQKSANVGEMGELLREENEGHPNGLTGNGRTGVNVEDTNILNKEAEKKQDAIPPKPTIRTEGVSKPEDPSIKIRGEAVVINAAQLTAVEPTSDVAAVVNKPSDELKTKQAVESTVKSTPELVHALKELQAPVAAATAEDSLQSPKGDTPTAVHTEPSPSVPSIDQDHSVGEDPSLEDCVMSTSDAPGKAEAVLHSEETITAYADVQGSTEPAALEDATAIQPSSSFAPNGSISMEPEISPLSETLALESAVSESQHVNDRVTAPSVEEPPVEVISGKPEEGPTVMPEDIVPVDPELEVGVDPTVEHAKSSISPAVPAEDDGTQEPEILIHDAEAIPIDEEWVPSEDEHAPEPEILTHNAEAVPIDEEWLENAEPAVSHSDISTDEPITVNPEGDATVIGNTTEELIPDS